MLTLRTPAASRRNRTLSPSSSIISRILFAALLALGVSQLAARAATLTVGAGASNQYHDLQSAIDAAQPGDTISVQAGETFYGNFVLRNKNTTSTAYITIQSSAVGSLPAGVRVDLTKYYLMPRLVASPSPSTIGPAIATEAGAHHYRLIGLEIVSEQTSFLGNLVALGSGGQDQTLLTQVPYSLVVDRCLIHASASQPAKRGIALNSRDTQIMNSYIAGFKLVDDDAEAIQMGNGPGQYEITNNYIEASTENIIVNGGINWIQGLIPSDITIRGNYIAKPLSWYPQDPSYANIPWRLKNLLELKTGKRITIEGNVIENSWQSAGDGNALVIVCISNDDGKIPSWQVPQIEDITVRNNIIRHAASGVNLDGKWMAGDGSYLRRVQIVNNVFEDIDARWGDNYGRLFIVNDGADYVTIEHNTAFNTNPVYDTAVKTDIGTQTNFVFRNNIVRGDVRSGLNNHGDEPLNASFPGAVWTRNIQIGGGPKNPYYDGHISTPAHPDNDFPSTVSGVGFVDYAGHNYRLLPGTSGYHTGTDGKDVGADMDAIDAAMAGAESLSLNGTNAYALVSSTTSLSIGGPITVEAWFKVNSIGAYQTIIAKESYMVSGTGGGYELQITNTGKVRVNFYQDYNAYLPAVGTTTVTPGVWHHAAATFDGATRRVFLDGVLEVSAAGGGPGIGSGNLRIGRRNNSTNTYYFNGLIDEVRVSNAALYSANFTPLRGLAPGASTMGLWKFNDQTAADSSGNGNNGTLQGAAAFSTDAP